jgi:hypothetical protein
MEGSRETKMKVDAYGERAVCTSVRTKYVWRDSWLVEDRESGVGLGEVAVTIHEFHECRLSVTPPECHSDSLFESPALSRAPLSPPLLSLFVSHLPISLVAAPIEQEESVC